MITSERKSGVLSISSRTASSKINHKHLSRIAIVYVRQSTQQQVLANRESRERQYALASYASELGWPSDRILIIDEDQGISGKSADNRPGFQRLLSEVSLKHVGLVLRSERYTDDSSQLTFFAAEQDVQPEATAEVDEFLEEVTYTRRKRSKAERFPANLPREVQMINVPEAERACPCCGEEMPIIDTDVRERLVW